MREEQWGPKPDWKLVEPVVATTAAVEMREPLRSGETRRQHLLDKLAASMKASGVKFQVGAVYKVTVTKIATLERPIAQDGAQR